MGPEARLGRTHLGTACHLTAHGRGQAWAKAPIHGTQYHLRPGSGRKLRNRTALSASAERCKTVALHVAIRGNCRAVAWDACASQERDSGGKDSDAPVSLE